MFSPREIFFPRMSFSMVRFVQPTESQKPNRIVSVLLALVALVVFMVLGCLARGNNPVTELDARVHAQLLEHAFQSPALTALCRLFTALGDVKTLALLAFLGAVGLGAVAAKTGAHYNLLAFWVTGNAGAGLLNVALKNVFQRPRPDQDFAIVPAVGWSFPSGHVMGSLILFGMAAYLLFRIVPRRSWRAAAAVTAGILVLAIGFSRVYLGAHWLSDVLGAYGAGACWLSVCITLFGAYRVRSPQSTGSERLPPPQASVPSAVVATRPPGRQKTPWRRARKAEGGLLASDEISGAHVTNEDRDQQMRHADWLSGRLPEEATRPGAED